MSNLNYIILAWALVCSGLSYAEMGDARVIRSVWDMESQSCNGVRSNDMSRNRDEKIIKASKIVNLRRLGFRFKVPQFPQVEETVVKLNLGDRSRGVTDNYILISDQDLEAPFAAIVVTELPPQMATREQAFAAAGTLQRQLAMKSGYKINLQRLDGPHGPSLQMIVNNRVGSFCFPTSDFKFLPRGYDVRTIGISRFAFIVDKLVEFSIVVTLPDSVGNLDAVNYAESMMNDYWKRFDKI